MKLEFSPHIFEKYTNIRFHKNPPSESSVVASGRIDGQIDMTKLISAILRERQKLTASLESAINNVLHFYRCTVG